MNTRNSAFVVQIIIFEKFDEGNKYYLNTFIEQKKHTNMSESPRGIREREESVVVWDNIFTSVTLSFHQIYGL